MLIVHLMILKEIYFIYSKIIKARVIKTQSIIVAEAAKIIENIQRDVNIGLINELAMIFDKMKINTQEVLKAASTKWNFLSFKPGLVGGHCIGIDPYYLNYKSKKIGIVPKIILAGRNDIYQIVFLNYIQIIVGILILNV